MEGHFKCAVSHAHYHPATEQQSARIADPILFQHIRCCDIACFHPSMREHVPVGWAGPVRAPRGRGWCGGCGGGWPTPASMATSAVRRPSSPLSCPRGSEVAIWNPLNDSSTLTGLHDDMPILRVDEVSRTFARSTGRATVFFFLRVGDGQILPTPQMCVCMCTCLWSCLCFCLCLCVCVYTRARVCASLCLCLRACARLRACVRRSVAGQPV